MSRKLNKYQRTYIQTYLLDIDVHLSIAVTAEENKIFYMWKNIPRQIAGSLFILSTCNPFKNQNCCVKQFPNNKSFSDDHWNIKFGNSVNLLCDHIKHQEQIPLDSMSMGHIYTNIVLNDNYDLKEINYERPITYGYCVSIVHWRGHVYHTTCLRTNPRWMQDHRDAIGNFQIPRLFLPGTHDSGAYNPYIRDSFFTDIFPKYAIAQVGLSLKIKISKLIE